LTCKGTLRQVFIKVYRLDIQSVMVVFWPSFVFCCPSNLLSGSLSPFPVWLSVLYTSIQCVRGREVWGPLGLSQINTCRKDPLTGQFFRWQHFALPFYVTAEYTKCPLKTVGVQVQEINVKHFPRFGMWLTHKGTCRDWAQQECPTIRASANITKILQIAKFWV